MNFKLIFSAALVASSFLLAIPGCAADTSDEATDDGSAEESATSHDELIANAAKLNGAYKFSGLSSQPPTFDGIVFEQNGDFFADVDTGIRCFRAPCPSNVRLTGTFTATKSYIHLNPKAGEPTNTYHGRYKYTLSSRGKLTLTRAGATWQNWQNALEKELSYCAAPTDCDAQGIIHIMCAGSWTCSEERSCAYTCGVPVPTNDIWPSDHSGLVAESPGGGFTAPPPPGSTCGIGKAKFTVDSGNVLSWETCTYKNATTPLQLVTGSRALKASELKKIDTAMNGVTLNTTEMCGADKPFLSISVTSPSEGTKKYVDSFYSCNGGNNTYVDNIDGIFSVLRDSAHP